MKDPAMLWYWNDWFSGTGLLSRFQKGCYMDLLHAQFNNGRLSLEEIKICLGSDFSQAWLALQKKFKQDENGLFFNERLEQEKNKRAAFSESRRNNRIKKPTELTSDIRYDKDLCIDKENENENRNVFIKEKETQKNFFKNNPLSTDVGELPDFKNDAVIELLKITKNYSVNRSQIEGMWKVFKTQNLTGKKYYAEIDDVYSHFMNWIRLQTFVTPEVTEKKHKGEDNLSAIVRQINESERLKNQANGK